MRRRMFRRPGPKHRRKRRLTMARRRKQRRRKQRPWRRTTAAPRRLSRRRRQQIKRRPTTAQTLRLQPIRRCRNRKRLRSRHKLRLLSTNKLDVATAIKSVVTPTTEVTATSASAKTDANVNGAGRRPRAEIGRDRRDGEVGATAAVIELGFASRHAELTVGEKRQLSLDLNSAGAAWASR